MASSGGNVKQPLHVIYGGAVVTRFNVGLSSGTPSNSIWVVAAGKKARVLGLTISGYFPTATPFAASINRSIEVAEEGGGILSIVGFATQVASQTQWGEAFSPVTLFFGSGVAMAAGADLLVRFSDGQTVAQGQVTCRGTVWGELY